MWYKMFTNKYKKNLQFLCDKKTKIGKSMFSN